jgi:hypothetical protein
MDTNISVMIMDEVMLTGEQFHNLSAYSFAMMLVVFPMVIEEHENELHVIANESRLCELRKQERYKEFNSYLWPSIEAGYIKIPKDNPVFTYVKAKYNHLFLKSKPQQ